MPPVKHREPDDESFSKDRPFCVGNDAILRVAARLARIAAAEADDGPVFCFAFGFPGTGKSTFSDVLAWDLNHAGSKYSFVEVNCLDISDSEPDDARHMLGGLRTTVFSKASYPMALMLDEIDAISADRGNGPPPSQMTTTHSTMRIVKEIRSQRLRSLVIGITNHPHNCDPTIKSEVGGAYIYFDPPNEQSISGIMDKQDVPDADGVAAEYTNLCRENGIVPMIRPLIEQIKTYKRLNLGAVSKSSVMAERLLALGTLPTRDELDDYEDLYRREINQARSLQQLLGADK